MPVRELPCACPTVVRHGCGPVRVGGRAETCPVGVGGDDWLPRGPPPPSQDRDAPRGRTRPQRTAFQAISRGMPAIGNPLRLDPADSIGPSEGRAERLPPADPSQADSAWRRSMSTRIRQAVLSQARGLVASASAGTRAVLAGGNLSPSVASDVVDICDSSAGMPSVPAAWSAATLSSPRTSLAAAADRDTVLLAGGVEPIGPSAAGCCSQAAPPAGPRRRSSTSTSRTGSTQVRRLDTLFTRSPPGS